MIIKRRPKKKELWMETPDGQKFRHINVTEDDQDRVREIKEQYAKNLIGSKYSIDQFKFYFK